MNTFNFNIDYYGLCHGNCTGCLLTQEERASDQLFQSNASILKSFSDLLRGTDIKDEGIIAFGRGNLLLLNDEMIDSLVKLMNDMTLIMDRHGVKRQVFELSTSLIGPYEQQLSAAKKLSQQKLSTFVVVADGALVDKNNYWGNIRRFLDDMSFHRGGRDGSGDVLGLNITLRQLPDIDYLKRFLNGVRSPINIIWSPTLDSKYLNDISIKHLGEWLEAMSLTGDYLGWDLNINNIAELSLRTATQSDDSYQIIHESRQRNFILDKEGGLSEGLFCIFGDIDPMRSAVVISKGDTAREAIEADAISKLNKMQKRSRCLMCPFQKACVGSGSYQYIGFISAHLNDKKACPTGLFCVFDRLSNAKILANIE